MNDLILCVLFVFESLCDDPEFSYCLVNGCRITSVYDTCLI
jgi:hypothetical protein